MRSASVGLLTMTTGCLLFIPASSSAAFPLFLLALFVLAAGITTVQVVANPLISMLGTPHTAHSRLTFAQAFNSLGTTIFPYFGSLLILETSWRPWIQVRSTARPCMRWRAAESIVVRNTYLGLAVALLLLALAVWRGRRQLVEQPVPRQHILRAFDLLRQPRFAFGALGIFLYVGAEVAIGSIDRQLPDADLGDGSVAAGGRRARATLLGRRNGWPVHRCVATAADLSGQAAAMFAAAMVLLLLLVSATTTGPVSGWALLSIGLFNSIMFPTIFSLACEGLAERAAEGSGIICMAIVGGAIVPLLLGAAADNWGLHVALFVPALCYLGILLFGWMARRSHQALLDAPVSAIA